MKTIEERAIALENEILSCDCFPLGGIALLASHSLREQKAIDIEKACEWLKAYCGMNESGLVQFRKAMEE